MVPGNDPTPEGNPNVWPGIDGGANWMSHSYSPLTKLVYVFAREERRIYTKNAVQHPTTDPAAIPQGANAIPAGRVRGGYDDCLVVGIDCGKRLPTFAPEESYGKAVAIDPATGTTKWEHRVLSPPWGGLMSTAGNLVFGGTIEGVIFALNATTGERLWTFSSNGPVYGTAISYLADGKQFVSIPAGDLIVTFALD